MLKSKLLQIVDSISPLEPIQLKPISNCPWLDDDLKYLAAMRDRAYKDFKISKLDSDKDWFKKLKVDFEKLNNLKMIEFFDKKKSMIFQIVNYSGNFIILTLKLKVIDHATRIFLQLNLIQTLLLINLIYAKLLILTLHR